MDLTVTPPAGPVAPDRTAALLATAQELEATFLAEMLGHAGLGAPSETFGGGHGEEQFTSFLKQEQARLIVQRGGIGLAELIFNSMAQKETPDGQ